MSNESDRRGSASQREESRGKLAPSQPPRTFGAFSVAGLIWPVIITARRHTSPGRELSLAKRAGLEAAMILRAERAAIWNVLVKYVSPWSAWGPQVSKIAGIPATIGFKFTGEAGRARDGR